MLALSVCLQRLSIHLKPDSESSLKKRKERKRKNKSLPVWRTHIPGNSVWQSTESAGMVSEVALLR